MSKVILSAKSRENKGSGEARRIRKAGRIPGVLYGRKGVAISLDLDATDFAHQVKTISESTIVKVEIDGKSYDAFVKDTQRNILDGNILHVDFYEVESGVLLKARVSLQLRGNPIGVRQGGVLENPLHDIEVECMPADLPERIIVDVSELAVNQALFVRDLPIAKSIRIISNVDQMVAQIKLAREEAPAPTAAAEGEEQAAEGETEAKD